MYDLTMLDNSSVLLIQDDSELSECPSLGEVLVSLCHNPTEGRFTITIKSAEGLQRVSHTGTISKSYSLYFVTGVAVTVYNLEPLDFFQILL